ncbi:MAG: GNAT family N-acetyltransferase [Rhodanobacteraceae bacterium]
MSNVESRLTGAVNLLEPAGLVQHFLSHPPLNFSASSICEGVPTFVAPFDLLTTADARLKRLVGSLPFFRRWNGVLRPRTFFVGTTVTEYAVWPAPLRPDVFADCLVRSQARDYRFVIVKDLPQASPLLDRTHNALAHNLVEALGKRGFALIEGQALAYLAIDFPDIDVYLSRLSYRRRKDIRRKLRSRKQLRIGAIPAGSRQFADDALLDQVYALYLNVYRQSEIQFDQLSREFFAAVLRDADSGGVMFVYHQDGDFIGFNLCFVTSTMLVDKYIGFAYPQARELNLYFVSWIHNLEYALRHGLSTYVAGWTDPEIKAYLGASFTMTQHAVYIRNPLLRFIFRRIQGRFESDRQWQESVENDSGRS